VLLITWQTQCACLANKCKGPIGTPFNKQLSDIPLCLNKKYYIPLPLTKKKHHLLYGTEYFANK